MFRWLLQFIWPSRYKVLLAVCFGVISNLAVVLIPFLSALCVWQLALGDTTNLTRLICLILGCGVVRGFARYSEQYLNHDIAFSLLASLRAKLFAKVRRLQSSFLKTKDSGDLITSLTSDVEALEVFFAHTVSPVAIYLVSTVITTIWMSRLWGLGAIILLLGQLLVGIVLPYFSWHKHQQIGQSLQENLAQLNQVVMQQVQALADIKQYGLQKQMLTTLHKKGQALDVAQKQQLKQESLLVLRGEIILILTATSILGLGVYQQLDPAVVLLSTILSLSCFGPALALNNLGSALLAPLGSAKRLYQLSCQDEAVKFKQTGALATEPQNLQAKQVTFGYHEKAAVLSDIDLTLTKAKMIGIGGKSGSGKSTLVNLLKRVYDPWSGSICFEQTDIKDLSEHNLRKYQGIMEQQTFIFAGTIAQNIALARPDASLEQIKLAATKANLAPLIESLPDKYQTQIGTPKTHQLSDGEKQRLGLARLFLKDAPFWILDEPTSRLDYLNEREIMQNVRQNTQDKAVLVISHRQTTLQNADVCYDISKHKLKRSSQDANC